MIAPGGSAFYESLYKRTLEVWSDEHEHDTQYARKARKVLVAARKQNLPVSACATCDCPAFLKQYHATCEWEEDAVANYLCCKRCQLVLRCSQLATCVATRENDTCVCPLCGADGCTKCSTPCSVCTAYSCRMCTTWCLCYQCRFDETTPPQMVCEACKKECPACGEFVSTNCDFTCC